MSAASRSHLLHRSSISPFRSLGGKYSTPPPPRPPSSAGSSKRPATPSSAPPSRLSATPTSSSGLTDRPETNKAKENVTVTVRFRPLSLREMNKGDEVAWYADGDYTVRNEYNPDIAYGFDRVFGPETTTRHVYDVAAQHVVSSAMQGINGTVFAYGVTSSGKTHTMHGEQKSPGVIPLAVKDVFGIIQETPGREFLLRVSYLEIYNEVINDLLDPTGQNLRIREDAQGIYVEGIKEEVVLSPAHALSLIASGEAHRHVGSNNFNLLSSRSRTIFTLTVESSSQGENQGDEDVILSQLHLIDLAGSESSKTETTGLRRKEGSYINKSLLTLGTVISKLTDGKAVHIPYRDSKLTRLLQSSLGGHGKISLICNVTPASSNTEETHNTLKFAHRSKHVEIKASQNKIMDEKSLIKKYQKEISCLKEELQQLKQGMVENPPVVASSQEKNFNLKLQLEAGQVKLQSRLEEEEQAKAALMERIQRLTKLILVSTKNSMPHNISERSGQRRRHSFGEDELAYLPDRKREYLIDDDAGSCASEFSQEGRDGVNNLDELVKDYKKNKKRGMLGWFKLKKPDNMVGSSPNTDSGSSASGSPASCSKSSQSRFMFSDTNDGSRKSIGRHGDNSAVTESFPERTQAGDLFSGTNGGRRLPPSGMTITDQMDLLQEQMKMLVGEVALCTSSLKRLSERAAKNPEDSHLKEHMQKLKDEISGKKHQIHVLEKRVIGSVEITPHVSNTSEMSQALSKLTAQLTQKTFELEIKSADNRILQEQLQTKIQSQHCLSEHAEMQETIHLLREQLNSVTQQSAEKAVSRLQHCSKEILENDSEKGNGIYSCEEAYVDVNTPTSVMSLNKIFSHEDSKEFRDNFSNTQVLMQAAEMENMKQEMVKVTEEKDGLEALSRKLAEEATYAKELASAAAVELRNLAEEVTRLSYENAKLTGDLAAVKEAFCRSSSQRFTRDLNEKIVNCAQSDERLRKSEGRMLVEELQKELGVRHQREVVLNAALFEKDQVEGNLRRRLDEAKQREQELENELTNMWMRKSNLENISFERIAEANKPKAKVKNANFPVNGHAGNISSREHSTGKDGVGTFEELEDNYQNERSRCKELESIISRFKGEDITDLEVATLEEFQNLRFSC